MYFNYKLQKKSSPNYIGGNTFFEMGYGYRTGKKIFILNEMPTTSAYKEVMLGMQPIILSGDILKVS